MWLLSKMGQPTLQKVSVARDLGTTVEARDGVKKGDLVILNPPVDLVPGRRSNRPAASS